MHPSASAAEDPSATDALPGHALPTDALPAVLFDGPASRPPLRPPGLSAATSDESLTVASDGGCGCVSVPAAARGDGVADRPTPPSPSADTPLVDRVQTIGGALLW